jgi:hypothetical protein
MSGWLSSTEAIGFVFLDDDGDGIPETPHVVLQAPIFGVFRFSSGTGEYDGIRGVGKIEGCSCPILDAEGQHVIGFCDGSLPILDFEGNYIGNPASGIELSGRIKI